MYHDNKTQAFETYNSSSDSAIPNICPIVTIIDLSAIVYIKASIKDVKAH